MSSARSIRGSAWDRRLTNIADPAKERGKRAPTLVCLPRREDDWFQQGLWKADGHGDQTPEDPQEVRRNFETASHRSTSSKGTQSAS